MTPLTEDVVRRIGTDPDALETFYRTHVRDIERFIARRVADPHDAADLTADVFLTLATHAATYRPERGSLLGGPGSRGIRSPTTSDRRPAPGA